MSSEVTNISPANPQIDDAGHLKHFLTVEGLTKTQLLQLLDAASVFVGADNAKRREQANLLAKQCVEHLAIFDDDADLLREAASFVVDRKR